MKGRKIRIRQGVKGWLLALAMVLSLCSGWKQDVCAQQSQSSSSNLMQDVDTDKKGSIEILFDTMRDEPLQMQSLPCIRLQQWWIREDIRCWS